MGAKGKTKEQKPMPSTSKRWRGRAPAQQKKKGAIRIVGRRK